MVILNGLGEFFPEITSLSKPRVDENENY